LQRRSLEIDHVAVLGAAQRQRDVVGAEQRTERRIRIVPQCRHLDLDSIVPVDIVADESESGVSAAKLSRRGVDHAGAGAMNGMKFDPV